MAATLRDVQAKRALRAEMREVRRRIAADPAGRRDRSTRIWAAIVAAVELGPRRRVMLFRSLPTEPDTAAWFAWCRDHDVAVFVPIVAGPDLHVGAVDRMGSVGHSGLTSSHVDPTVLDVVVVPGLAFTADGRRLGQGGGHYDRFLPRLRTDCLTVGVAFAEQLVADVPTEAHDIRLDLVVTDA